VARNPSLKRNAFAQDQEYRLTTGCSGGSAARRAAEPERFACSAHFRSRRGVHREKRYATKDATDDTDGTWRAMIKSLAVNARLADDLFMKPPASAENETWIPVAGSSRRRADFALPAVAGAGRLNPTRYNSWHTKQS
jgi:hypothetical protein